MTIAPSGSPPGVQPLQLPWDLRLTADQWLDRWQALSPEQRKAGLTLDLGPIWDV